MGAPIVVDGEVNGDPEIPQGPHREHVWSMALTAPSYADVTLSSIRLQRRGTASDSDVPMVEAWSDENGNGAWDGQPTDLKVGEAKFVGGVAELSRLNLPIPQGETRRLLFVVHTSAEAKVGRSFVLSIRFADDVKFAEPYAYLTGTFPRESPQFTIRGNKVTVSLDPSVSPPSEVAQGERGVVLCRLLFEVDSGVATLSGMLVELAGEEAEGYARNADLSSLRLYLDNDPQGSFGTEDRPLTEPARPVGRKAKFDGLLLSLYEEDKPEEGKPKRRAIFVVADIAETAEPGRKLAVALPRYEWEDGLEPNVVLKGDDVVDPANFPLRSAETVIKASAETLQVMGESIAPERAWIGKQNVALLSLRFRLKEGKGSATITSLTFHLSGDPEAVTLLHLHRDSNGNGKFDPEADVTVGTATFDASGVAQIDGNLSLPVRGAREERFFAVVNLSADASPNTSLSLTVGPGDVEVAAPDSVASFSPISSDPVVLGHGLSASAQSLAPTSVRQGQEKVPMLYLELTCATGSVEIKGLKVRRTGIATSSDVRNVHLFRDANENGQFDEGTDVEIAPPAQFDDEGIASFTGLSLLTPQKLILLVDVEPKAGGGRTFGLSLPSADFIEVAEPSVVVPENFPLRSDESFVAVGEDKLAVQCESLAPSSVGQGETKDFLKLIFVAGPKDIRISSLRLDRRGTASDEDVPSATLAVNGEVKEANFTGATTTFTGLALTIPANSKVEAVVALKVSPLALTEKTVQVSVEDPSYITVETGQSVDPSTFPLRSATSTITGNVNTLTVSGQSLAPEHASPGQRNVPLLKLQLDLDAEIALLQSLTVTALSAEPEKVVERLVLKADDDLDGEPDRILTSAKFEEGKATFSNLNLTIEAKEGPELALLVYADLLPEAATGTTLKVGLESAEDVAVKPPDTAQLKDGAAIRTDDISIVRLLYVAGTSLAPSQAEQGQKDVALMRLTLLPSSGEVTVSGLDYSVSPTADVENVRLYRDANGNGSFDASDELIQSWPQTASSAQALVLFIVADIAVEATAGDEVVAKVKGVSVAEPDVVASLPDEGISSQPCKVAGNTLSVQSFPTMPDGTTPVPPASVAPGQTDIPIFRLLLAPSMGSARLTALRIKVAKGRTEDIQTISLYRATDDQFQPLPQLKLASTDTFVGDEAILSSLDLPLTSPLTLYVACDLKAGVELGQTFAFQIPEGGVVVDEPDEASANFPLTSTEMTTAPTLSVSGLADGDVPAATQAGALNVLVLKLLLSASYGPAKLKALTLALTGDVEEPHLSGVKLFLDDGDGKFDPYKDEQVTASTPFAQGKARLEVREEVVVRPGVPARLFVAADVAEGAEGGRKFGVEIQSPSWVEATYSADGKEIPVLVSSTGFPIQSKQVMVGDKLAVSGESVAPARIGRQVGGYTAFLKLNFSVPTGSITVKALKFRRLGTSRDSAIKSLALFKDDGDEKFDYSLDLLLVRKDKGVEQPVFVNGEAELSGFDLVVTPERPATLFVALILDAEAAESGRTIGLSLAHPDDISVADAETGDAVQPYGFPINSHLATIGDAVTLSGFPLAPEEVGEGKKEVVWKPAPQADSIVVACGERRVGLLTLPLSTPAASSTLLSLTVRKHEEATAYDTDVEAFYLYEDTDADGKFNPSEDRQLAGPAHMVEAKVTFSDLNLEFSSEKPLKLFVAADISPQAGPNRKLRVKVSGGEREEEGKVVRDIELADPDVIDTAPVTVASNTLVFKESTVVVRAVDAGKAKYFAPGDEDVPLLVLSLNLKPGGTTEYSRRVSVLLTSLEAKLVGTLTSEYLSEIRLYADMPDSQGNFDGVLNMEGADSSRPADALLATAKAVGDKIRFTGLNVSIPPVQEDFQPRHFYLVADILPSAPLGTALKLRLDSPDFVKVEEPNVVWLEAMPLEGHEVRAYLKASVLLPKGYSLFSIPVVPPSEEFTDPSKVLGTQWAAAWDAENGRWMDLSKGEAFSLAVGRGCLVKLDQTKEISLPWSEEPPSERLVPLKVGWNLIGHPATLEIPLEDLEVAYQGRRLKFAEAADQGIVLGYAWGLWGAQKENGTVHYELVHPEFFGARRGLEPWHGYWFKALKECDLVVPTQPRGRGPKLRSDEGVKLCGFRIVAQSEGTSDPQNFLALVDEPRRAKELSAESPPPATSMPFDLQPVRSPDDPAPFGYAVLASPLKGGRAEWWLRVVSDGAEREVSLLWPDLRQVPKELCLLLVDPSTGQKVNMRTQSSYTLRLRRGERVRWLKVEALSVNLRGRLRIEWLGAPVRTGGGLALAFRTTKEAEVSAVVLTSSGRVVRRLMVRRPLSAGAHSLVWDGRSERGSRAPAGLYLVVLEGRTHEGERVRISRFIHLR